MCGIAGLITSNHKLDKQSILKKMLDSTKHRGPNHTGMYVKEEAAIGMNRLSILDLSEAANQPMFSKDRRYVIVYNGEVYNYKELKADLMRQGSNFLTSSDTEVVLEMYICYGEKMMTFLRGMFAFVIWDTLEKKTFGARDHLGIKPLIYWFNDNNFLFCSELKGIIASEILDAQLLDFISISNYLTVGHTIAPRTMLDGVKSLKAASFFVYQDSVFKEQRYWQPEHILPFSTGEVSYQAVVQHVRELVLSSVNEQLVSDVPLGVFLSGGLDSSIVTAAMLASGAGQIDTYSVGFDLPNLSIDETDDAQYLAEYFHTRHHSVKVNDQFIQDNFIDYVLGLDQPSADGLNTYLVSKYANDGVTVALSGLGADEIFCGYKGFFSFLSKESGLDLPWLQDMLSMNWVRSVMPERIYTKLHEKLNMHDDIFNYIFLLQRTNESFNTAILNPDFKKYGSYSVSRDMIIDNYQFSNVPINKIRQLYVNLFMTNMLLRDSDAVAMKNSLEVRFPLIDYRLVEYAYAIPLDYLINKNISNISPRSYGKGDIKRVLKDAFLQELPDALLGRTKRGFQLPINHWMNNPLEDMIEECVQNPCYIFEAQVVKKAYQGWKRGIVSWKKIWSFFMLDIWYKVHIEKKY